MSIHEVNDTVTGHFSVPADHSQLNFPYMTLEEAGFAIVEWRVKVSWPPQIFRHLGYQTPTAGCQDWGREVGMGRSLDEMAVKLRS